MVYATVEEVEAGFRVLTNEEQARCDALLDEAGAIIDIYAAAAAADMKKLVSCRMVRRLLGDGGEPAVLYPMGASQGSASALGYTQSWTMNGGSSGELYLSKLEKRLLGCGDRIGARSPVEGLCHDSGN